MGLNAGACTCSGTMGSELLRWCVRRELETQQSISSLVLDEAKHVRAAAPGAAGCVG